MKGRSCKGRYRGEEDEGDEKRRAKEGLKGIYGNDVSMDGIYII